MDPSGPTLPTPRDTLSLAETVRETIRALSPRETVRLRPEGIPSPRLASWQKALPRITIEPAAADASDASLGGDLEVRDTLGEGGMGRVVLAWQRSLQREVAVKMRKASAPRDEAQQTVLREGRITGSLEHPGIVPVHTLAIDENGEPLFVMKRIAGSSWRDLLRDPAHPLLALLPGGHEDTLETHLFVLSQVCNAVHFAHSRGVIHRDIKPENVMVGAFGEVYLVDWGVAAELPAEGELRADEHELMGTPIYMAPEMISASVGPLGARSDVFLLGAVLHEVLTGAPPHQRGNIIETLAAALHAAPPRFGPDVPTELGALCARALARDPEDRPASALALRQAIDAFLRHRGVEALVRKAEERLSDLRRLLAAGEKARGEVRRVGIECRFAFRIALEAWPESAAAQEGREACLELLFEDAVGQRQASEAEALLGEMSDPPPALHERLAALRAREAEQEAHAEALRRLANDHDARLGARPRAFLIALVLVGVLIGFFVQGTRLPTHKNAAMILSATTLLTIAAAVSQWSRLANAYSRRLIGLLVFLNAACLAQFFLGWARAAPVQDLLSGMMLSWAMVLGAAPVLGYPRLLPGALSALGGVTLSVALPRQIGVIFPATAVVTLIGCIAPNLSQGRGALAAPRR